jgi:serine/threonine-protein kinase
VTEAQQHSAEVPEVQEVTERDPLIGTVVAERYRVEGVLGTGGMGTVYLAEHELMEKKVALKVLHPTLAVVASVMERFQHEAVALSRIEHPNVVNATDFGKLPNGAYYLALQYVEGRDLAQVLKQETALEPERAARIALQVARALDAAHSEGIVHRDLKPHNVMLASGGDDGEQAKVLDFGLAKLRSKTGEGRPVSEGSVFGTPHYISPEQVGGADVDGRADLYCLGLILYEMLAGRRAFDGRDVKDVLRRQVSEAPEPLPKEVPEVLRTLVEQLMQKLPDGRPDSAATVVGILEQMLAPPSESLLPAWLARPVAVGRFEAPTWAIALPGAAFLALFLLGLVMSSADESRVATGTSPPAAGESAPPKVDEDPEVLTIPEPDQWLALMSAAEFGDDKAIAELLEIPPEKRGKDVWLVLGEGYMKSRRTEQALDVYREAIAHQPELADEEKIAVNVRLATKDGQTAALAVGVAAESLGQRGVNILFSTWADTARRTKASALAERYLKEDKVLSKASQAVKIALELREVQDCSRLRELLTAVKEHGDTRTLRPLAKMRAVKGCGKNKRSDCYPCLREDTLLEDAIQAAAERIGPKD